MAVRPGAFDGSRLPADAVVDRFASQLRAAGLFQGVMYPVPEGVIPTWEIELSGTDRVVEPDSNFWKSALAAALPPAALFVTLENDYTLRLEALVLKNRVLVESYAGEEPVRNRRKLYANKTRASAEGMEVAVRGASQRVLAALARDLPRLLEADRY